MSEKTDVHTMVAETRGVRERHHLQGIIVIAVDEAGQLHLSAHVDDSPFLQVIHGQISAGLAAAFGAPTASGSQKDGSVPNA